MGDHETIAKTLTALGFHSFGNVTTFKGYRKSASGDDQHVTVEISENRSGDMPRYWVKARDDQGRPATGNGHDDLDLALRGVHWQDLDK